VIDRSQHALYGADAAAYIARMRLNEIVGFDQDEGQYVLLSGWDFRDPPQRENRIA